MKQILVAEDDKEINRLLCEFLLTQGYEPISVTNGLDVVRIIHEKDDIILLLLDLMLPFQSGDMVLHKIREFSDIPVIVVSAKSETYSKIDLLKNGADDYVTKPFDLDELLVRIEAVLRRYEGSGKNKAKEEIITFKNLRMDVTAGTVMVCEKPLVLTGTEFAILKLMIQNPTKLYSKANLFESVWGEEYLGDESTLKVHMSNLRNKLKKLDPGQEYIETVWGMGYRLVN